MRFEKPVVKFLDKIYLFVIYNRIIVLKRKFGRKALQFVLHLAFPVQ